MTGPERRPAGHTDDIEPIDEADWRDQLLSTLGDEETPGVPEAAIAGAGTKEPVPEGDLLEQSIPLDPLAHDPEPTRRDRDHLVESVDVADWLEQQIPVLGSDDDYPRHAETHGS